MTHSPTCLWGTRAGAAVRPPSCGRWPIRSGCGSCPCSPARAMTAAEVARELGPDPRQRQLPPAPAARRRHSSRWPARSASGAAWPSATATTCERDRGRPASRHRPEHLRRPPAAATPRSRRAAPARPAVPADAGTPAPHRRRAVGRPRGLGASVTATDERRLERPAPRRAAARTAGHDPGQRHHGAVRDGAGGRTSDSLRTAAPSRLPLPGRPAGWSRMAGNALAPIALAFAVLDLTGSATRPRAWSSAPGR